MLALFLSATTALAAQDAAQRTVVVGSKNFTESALLAEILAQIIEERTGLTVERRTNLGGTLICHSALVNGAIDIYPEYTGTAWATVLGETDKVTDPLRAFLAVERHYETELGVLWLSPFGFENTYAIALREDDAVRLGIERISDLASHAAELRGGFSHEFTNREDGWPGLSREYEIELATARGMEHGLAYMAIEAGSIDVMDAYSTDAKLLRYALRTLEDDRRFFPPYHAAPLVRAELLRSHPEVGAAIEELAFRITNERMQGLNHRVEEGGLSVPAVAREFLGEEGLLEAAATEETAERGRGFVALMRARAGRTLDLVLEHLALTSIAVLLAALVAIPLGVAITRRPRLRRAVLGVAGVLQTIPSLALLALMIPLLGLDVRAAVAALFLYALLPIVRNTYTGIAEVDPELIEAARGIGLSNRQVLLRIELPLATRTIMAGVRTATVISIGVATLAAFIGAGGLGEPIVTGLYLNDTDLILAGALPAAALAILTDWLLGWAEARLAPCTTAAES